MKAQEINTEEQFNLLLEEGIELAENAKDKLFKAALKNLQGFIGTGVFELDLNKAVVALTCQKPDYQERTEFIENLSKVVESSVFTTTNFDKSDRVLMQILVNAFQKNKKIIHYKRLKPVGGL